MQNPATRDQVIATAHGLHLSLAAKLRIDAGATNEDVAIASAYAALDNATILAGGDKDSAIAWLRNALWMIEADQPLRADNEDD